MTTPKKSYKRGSLPNHIEFDPSRAFSKAGGNGEIYRGKLHLKSYPDGSPFQYSYVALKRMRWGTDDEDRRLESIIEESYVWMRLDHPNVLRFLGLLHEDEDIYLVAPFAAHGSLPEYLVAYPDADRRMFLWQIAAGLAYLHSQKIVHGDLKGANILVFDGPTAKICDFGLSKIYDERQTTNPQISLPWTSPERLLGAPRSYASDVYAFGMTIYEVLSGKIPFLHKCSPFGAFVRSVCEEGMRPPKHPDVCCAGVSYVLHWMIAEWCWQKAPEGRLSMSEVRDDIAPTGGYGVVGVDLDDLPVLSMPPPSSDITSRRRPRMDSAETMRAAESSRPASKRKIYPNPTVDEPSSYETPEPTSTRSSFAPQIQSLPRAKSASHQAAKRSSVACLPGTRITVLQKIDDWIKKTDPDTPSIFWLNGMAGTGKSTIAKTLAEAAEGNGVLGASFFFDRQGHSEVRNGDLFIPTIAFQLAQALPSFSLRLASVLEKNVDVLSFTRHSQLQTLIAGPFQNIKLANPVIVIIDALDECEPRDAKELLQLLLQMTSRRQIPHALKIFISCRPDRELDITFRTARSHQLLLLHEVEEDVVQADIEMYITNGLTNPPPHPSLPPDWISTPDLKELTRRSGKLFIYATTVLKYIRDNELDSSRDRLRSLLATRHSTKENPLADLDDLYLQVLRMAIKSRNPRATEMITKQAADRVRCLLAILVLLRTPLPLGALTELVKVPLDQMQTTLEHIQSVVMTPKSVDDHPQFLHQSFPDFIINPNRCSDHQFLVDAQDHEHRLADHCLTAMIASLKRNVSGSTTEMETKTEVKREVAYACSYWASHLAKAPPGSYQLLGKLDQFVNRCLLWWLEALSVIGQVGKAARAADDAFKWAVLSSASKQTIALLRDAHRFVLAHPKCISDDPNHIYSSALPFTPRATSLWKLYSHEAVQSVQVLFGVEEDWLPCLGVLAGHEGCVDEITFSPDGTRIVSASKDNTVRVWDVASWQSIAILEGHSKEVTTVAFSPEGTQIVSGSGDRTVRIWDATSGKSIAILKGHSKDVTTVAFSPDGTRIGSASKDWTVRIWDGASGQSTAILKDHSSVVYSLAFSSDGTRIVSGSRDKTLRIWDVALGQSIATLEGHSKEVTAVLFSPDGTLIVSASNDSTARIWDAVSGQSITILEGHSSSVYSIAFSPDCTQIVTGSGDKTGRIWDAASGQSIAILKGHSAQLTSVTFLPNGSRIVSASNDRTVRIWNAASGQSIAVFEGHSKEVNSVAFSPEGTRIISASNDGALRIWDAESEQSTALLNGHSKNVRSITFTPDGTRVLSKSEDKTVCVRDTASGQSIATLKSQSRWSNPVIFSPDSTRIVIRSRDDTVHVWDAASMRSTAILEGYPQDKTTIAFSPDSTRMVTSSLGTVIVWDAVSGQCIAVLEGHSKSWTTAAFSPDSTRVVTTSWDAACVWDAVSGQSIAILEDYSSGRSLTFTPDSTRILVSSSTDMRVWDTASGQLIVTLKGHVILGDIPMFSPDSTRIVTMYWDTLYVWDAASMQPIVNLEAHGGATIEFSLDSTRMVTASQGTVRVWDAASGQCTAVMQDDSRSWTTAAFSPDSTQVVTTSSDAACVWDTASGRSITILEGYSGRMSSSTFSLDGTHVLLRSSNGGTWIWNSASGLMIVGVQALSGSQGLPIFPHEVVEEGAVVNMLSGWSRLGKIPPFLMCGLDLSSGCLSQDGSVAAVGCKNGRVFIFNYPSGSSSYVPSVVKDT